jgi:hypothetical protein
MVAMVRRLIWKLLMNNAVPVYIAVRPNIRVWPVKKTSQNRMTWYGFEQILFSSQSYPKDIITSKLEARLLAPIRVCAVSFLYCYDLICTLWTFWQTRYGFARYLFCTAMTSYALHACTMNYLLVIFLRPDMANNRLLQCLFFHIRRQIPSPTNVTTTVWTVMPRESDYQLDNMCVIV